MKKKIFKLALAIIIGLLAGGIMTVLFKVFSDTNYAVQVTGF